MKNLIIIGSGPAGYTAAIYSSRYNLYPTLITGTHEGGQLIKTNNIENWPGEYKGIKGIKLMERMKKQVLKFGTKIIKDKIIKVNFNKKPFQLIGEKKIYTSNTLIIATGTYPNRLNINYEKDLYGKGISTCATCDGFFYKNKTIAIVGGGNHAIEEALFLSRIVKKIYLIHRKRYFTAEYYLIKKLNTKINKKNFFFLKEKIIKKIYKTTNNNIKSIKIQSLKTKKFKKIKIEGLFLAIGQKPNTKIFKKQISLNKKGYIKCNNKYYKTMTNVKGIFAAGDVIDNLYQQAITACSSGCIAAFDVKKYLEKHKVI